ncbi:hypothetical protein OF897_15725 [Chryseobacterium formosus]|uniref:Uncharacterized protein n=1 Tax=Chryseobacterium formosus TaxID=1537363 RepID=A0ABT3XUR9_9FLAO|nr:hypothetical protein [Chryseobacterium formosus]MCX8525368.1 hypothetical protein [Chryseobacterium formosus]
MKYIFTVILAMASSLAFSQIAIGKSNVSNTSVSLEFGDNANKGIILPWVTSQGDVTGAVNGTIIYDVADKKVKYLKGGTWFDLTRDNTGAVNTSIQDNLQESNSAKAAIGSDGAADTTPGILVLTDTDKAMVLPRVASPHLNIISPAAGMMVYDTFNHLVAVYNGTVWSFWR